MNIEKLAKHLKEFTLDEIEMIAEENCKTELEQLLYANKIVFEQGRYKYQSVKTFEYDLFSNSQDKNKNLTFNQAIKYFMKNYVEKYCKKETVHQYNTIFKNHIYPYFETKNIQKITLDDIKKFYIFCRSRNLQDRRIKNILALLNQLLKYTHEKGLTQNRCYFQVKRLTAKNEFSENRLIFKENL